MSSASAKFVLHLAPLLFLVGCADAPKDPAAEPIVLHLPEGKPADRVSLKDFLASAPPPDPKLPKDAPRLIVRSLLVERSERRLAAALDMLDDPPLTHRLAEVWAQNGLRIGLIDTARLPMLMGNLPKPLRTRDDAFYSNASYSPVPLVDQADGQTRIKIVDGDGSVLYRRFFGGQYQMLTRAPPPKPGQPLRMELLPHRYTPRQSLMLRTLDQQIMEGDSFPQLHIDPPLRAEQVWVITADLRGREDAPSPRSEPSRGPQPRSARSEPLGRAMFTGRSDGREVQVILFLWLEEGAGKP